MEKKYQIMLENNKPVILSDTEYDGVSTIVSK